MTKWALENKAKQAVKPLTRSAAWRSGLLSGGILFGVLLTGCAAPPRDPAAPPMVNDMTQAVATPLSDLNVVRTEIPAVLEHAKTVLYTLPSPAECAAVQAELRQLDEALGPDLDTPATSEDPGLLERGVDVVGNSAVNTVRRTAESLIPFRSWVRKLTGAERQSRRVAAAITAGSVRRAFLKGWASASACAWPVKP